MEVIKNPGRIEWSDILARPVFDTKVIEDRVSSILSEIRHNGDQAVLKYTELFDNVRINAPEVSDAEIFEALNKIDPELKHAIDIASENIRTFHESQITGQKIIETFTGVKCWQRTVPIEKVGLYIPGGTAPLFSTVLMLGIPAGIAGCNEIVMCSPPENNGCISPVTLYAAHKVGINRIYKIGGVQAIGAMAWGTETIPRVYKIFGPGNQYVTAAKQLVNREGIAIDMPAGPSEVLVMADKSAVPEYVASDLLAQAEHGPDSQVLLVSSDIEVINNVLQEVNKQIRALPRQETAGQALKNSKAILLDSLNDILDLVNDYGPEHLIISMEDAEELAGKIINAGSVFIGNYTPESAGDYASGTNHTLPTNGYARVYSGVNLDSFVKKITFQKMNKTGLKKLGPVIEKMADAENLFAHKNAVSIRLK